MKQFATYCLVFMLVALTNLMLFAQDNVGIGTNTPHPSAILEITDSSRGVLITRSDTAAIAAYVNTLNPNPGIADGLLIMDTNVNTYMYYDAVADDWKELIGLVGPTGPRGFPGPPGPTGDTGLSTRWKDTAISPPPYNPNEDTCGDWFLNAETGKVWWLWCDSANGLRPPRYIDTLSYDNYIGELMAPEEKIIAEHRIWSGLSANIQNMANAGVNLVPISGLDYSVIVERDEIAYIWVTAWGTTSKAFKGSDRSYVQYDIEANAPTPNNFYYDRSPDSIAHIFTVGGNGPPAPGNPDGNLEFTGWHVSSFFILEGPVSPFPCGPCGPSPACVSCPPLTAGVNFQVTGGNRYTGSSGTSSFVVLGDATSTLQGAHMTVFAIIRRNPNTWDWKK